MVDQVDDCDCPLCMEPLEMDDLNFYPCTCGYQICRFCWHRLRTDENGLCPACRKVYTESPADYKPLTQEELQKIKQEKKHKELQRKQKVTESRKHLANVRVVQKNLVFVVGLSSRLADAETLKRMEYFGKFGKIHKVVINHTTSYAGSQGPSASAYVTYQRAEDALKAISQVNNVHVDGRTLKASLGTTKYCSHFMKNQQCPKNDCMYLHELGDEAASFTKEEMQQGKHQDFERKLQEMYLGAGANRNGGNTGGTEPLIATTATLTSSVTTAPTTNNKRAHKDSMSETSNGPSNVNARGVSVAAATGSGSANSSNNTPTIQPLDSIVLNPGEGWPSLHTGNSKDGSTGSANNATAAHTNGGSGVSAIQSNKKSRKHNSNSTNTNGHVSGSSAVAGVALNGTGSSPRQTPTRDHHHRRQRNEDSSSSSSGGRSSRGGESLSSANSTDSNSTAAVMATTPPIANTPPHDATTNNTEQYNSHATNTDHTHNTTTTTTNTKPNNKSLAQQSSSSSPTNNNKRAKSQSPPNNSTTSPANRNNNHLQRNTNKQNTRHQQQENQNKHQQQQILQREEEAAAEAAAAEVAAAEAAAAASAEQHKQQELIAACEEPEHIDVVAAVPVPSPSMSSEDGQPAASILLNESTSTAVVNGSLTLQEQQQFELQQQHNILAAKTDTATDSSFYADFLTIRNRVNETAPEQPSDNTEWAAQELRRNELLNDGLGSEFWSEMRNERHNEMANTDRIDDELGFDPFEETNKALAEDIIMEKKQKEEEQQRHQLQQQSLQQLQQQQQQHLQQQQTDAQMIRSDIKNFLSANPSLNCHNAARHPPPGFNGVSSLSNFTNNLQQQQNRLEVSKILPFLSGANTSSLGQVQQLNGIVPNRLGNGPPPGLSLLSNLQANNLDGGTLGVVGHPNQLLGALDPSGNSTLAQQPPPPPGLTLPKQQQQEPFVMKELENGLRNAFPSISSLNSLNNINSLNTLNSLNTSVGGGGNSLNTNISPLNTINGLTSLAPLASLSSLNSINTNSASSLNTTINFGVLNGQQQQQNSLSALNSLNAFGGLNLAAAQQQQQQQQNAVNTSGSNTLSNLFNISQQPPLPPPTLLHQIAIHNAQKGWSNNSMGNGGTDLTALDPAIVSSGQLTDSRSDSPPEWLRLVEQQISNSAATSGTAWPSVLPPPQQQQQLQVNNTSASLQQHLVSNSGLQASLLQHHQQQLAAAVQQQQHRQPTAWPPTSPPPGFPSISPMHQPKHKIDNL
uniref:CCR4-NOT transcription complex subunit 4 n=1 Tax=Hirondellea gigas TaxID=1518452 RepID=A0A2P2HWZ5_9CRUS